MTTRALLEEIRDGMSDLAQEERPPLGDIIEGLLLALNMLAVSTGGELERLAAQIHGDAQRAYRKAVEE